MVLLQRRKTGPKCVDGYLFEPFRKSHDNIPAFVQDCEDQWSHPVSRSVEDIVVLAASDINVGQVIGEYMRYHFAFSDGFQLIS